MARWTGWENGVSEELRGQVGVAVVCNAAKELMTGVPNMEGNLSLPEWINEDEQSRTKVLLPAPWVPTKIREEG
jgi:hypothetical protein